MKFNLGSLLNGNELPPQKKKVLALGGIAFVILLFASFLLSLSEDDNTSTDNSAVNNSNTVSQSQNGNGNNGSLQLPSSQVYDFEQNSATSGSGSLEDLLNSAPDNNAAGNSDPFAGMPGTRDEVNQSAPEESQVPDEVFTEAPLPVPGPAEIPTNTAKAVLICDSFASSQEAESQKAVLAFQGQSATVVRNNDNTYSLKVGPFDTDERARSVFNELGGKGLLNRCALLKQ